VKLGPGAVNLTNDVSHTRLDIFLKQL
jgi:hypothetical protein